MFEFPKPPTDNLYKFQALAGLSLILVSLVYPPWLYHQAILGYLAAKKEETELQTQSEYVQGRLNLLQNRLDTMIDDPAQLKRLLDDLERQRLTVAEEKQTALASEIDGLRKRWQESVQTREALVDASYELALSLRTKADQMTHHKSVSETEQWISRRIIYCGLFVLFVGAIITWTGFRKWNKRVQVFQDRILRQQAESKGNQQTVNTS